MKDEKKFALLSSAEATIIEPMQESRCKIAEETDDELRALLKAWHAPCVPSSLDDRVIATYRRILSRPPF